MTTGTARFDDLVAATPIAMLVLSGTDGPEGSAFDVMAANPAATTLLHLDGTAPSRRTLDRRLLGGNLCERLATAIRDGRRFDSLSVEMPGTDGTFSLRAVPLGGGGIGVTIDDVTRSDRTTAAFRHQATHDGLTGLANRVLLEEQMDRALAASERTGDQVALLIMDLDQFKEVNDALGHHCGDALLEEIAHRMSRRLRSCDTVARLGGDEFAVLVTSDATVEGARDVANRLTALAEEPVQVERYSLQVSGSVGIAIAPAHGTDSRTLMRHADAAMYEAKRDGRGYVLFQPESGTGAPRRMELLADLRDHGPAREVEVHYQPRFELATMVPTGIEALLRWHHPRHGLLPAAEFVELAEASGAIGPLARTVLSHACDALEHTSGRGVGTVSVNISLRNLLDPEWTDWLCDLVRDRRIAAGALRLELPESRLGDDPRQSVTAIRRLHDAGIGFALDHAGTGFPSLDLLADLPLVELKVDRRFTAAMGRGDDRPVRALIGLGHSLGMSVTADGVSDPDTVDQLRNLGCDTAQGFALGAPAPLAELLEGLGHHTGAAWKP